MIFSSIEFLLFFLPVFLAVYRLVPEQMKNTVLLAGSLIFYAYGEPKFLVLLMVSVLVNYFFGLHIGQGVRQKGTDRKQKKRKYDRRRKILFVTAIVLNVGMLALFKSGVGGVGLPLGISFYTFQILAYLIDVYRGDVGRETSFLRFATYITMFPQLISGPLVSYGGISDQLYRRKTDAAGLQEGLKVFTVGLAFKVLLADRLGFLWQEVQVTGFESISTPLAWIAAIAYSMKIYFDFYGYSLMAIGLGRMLGFRLPENFKEPYMSGTVREFYRRWHITLGNWFCRYVYIPLGGNRRGELRTVCNLLLVWTLTAVWHGSTANFLIWGMLLWLLIVVEKRLTAMGADGLFRKGILRCIPHLYLWIVIPVTWVCFAVTDVSQLQVYLGRMFSLNEGIRVSAGDWLKALSNYGYLLAAGAFACTHVLKKLFRRWKDSFVTAVILVVIFWVCIWRLQVEGNNPFMYSGF